VRLLTLLTSGQAKSLSGTPWRPMSPLKAFGNARGRLAHRRRLGVIARHAPPGGQATRTVSDFPQHN
jgi:hypothetical protein